MASTFSVKKVHRDGKTELTIGIDENAKTIDGIGKEIIIRNVDGSPAKIANENIVGMPENVSETNKLVTQEDVNKMMAKINNAIRYQDESMQELLELAKDAVEAEKVVVPKEEQDKGKAALTECPIKDFFCLQQSRVMQSIQGLNRVMKKYRRERLR